MKRHLAPALFSLSLCAVMGGVHTAGAQQAEVPRLAPAPALDTAIVSIAPVAAAVVTPEVVTSAAPGGATLMAPAPVGVTAMHAPSADASLAPGAVMADWKMPASRALIIGGAATAIVGLVVIGGDTGAIVALSGTAVAVYGLYLHYSR